MIKNITLTSSLLSAHCLPAINAEDAHKIGMQIFQNEASGREDLLVFWSQYEPFPSLGIGHNIWFPQGRIFSYTEQFPLLCDFLEKYGIQLPAWLHEARKHGAPWASRDEFLQDTRRVQELRNLLKSTIDVQTYFMIERLEEKLLVIIQEAPFEKQERVAHVSALLKSTTLGMYALIDYLNLKGDGLNPKEESNGERWGLAQVLLDMPDDLNYENVHKAFTISAAKILLRLVENSAPDYQRVKWLKGWINRVSSYANTTLF